MTTPNSNTVSIIIPAFNAAKTIEQAILSVVKQSYGNIEVIVVDGNSKDNTIAILQTLQSQYPISFISEKDKGVYDAMNKGISMAKGDWLYFLGADDTLHDTTVIEDMIGATGASDYDVLYGDVVFENSKKVYGGAYNTLRILQQNISHQAIFYKRHLFTTNGVYDLTYPILADYVFNLQWFSQKNVKRRYIHRAVAIFGEEGLSSTKRDLIYKKARVQLVKKYFGNIWYVYAVFFVPVIDLIRKLKRRISNS